MKPFNDNVLWLGSILRDELVAGLHVRKGAELNDSTIGERAANLADRIMARFHVSMRQDLCAVCVDDLQPDDALPFGPGRAHARCVIQQQLEGTNA